MRGRFAEVRAHDEEEFLESERLAQEEASLEAHAMKLPVVAAGDDDDGSVTSVAVAAQNFVQRGSIEVGQSNIKQDEVRL